MAYENGANYSHHRIYPFQTEIFRDQKYDNCEDRRKGVGCDRFVHSLSKISISQIVLVAGVQIRPMRIAEGRLNVINLE